MNAHTCHNSTIVWEHQKKIFQQCSSHVRCTCVPPYKTNIRLKLPKHVCNFLSSVVQFELEDTYYMEKPIHCHAVQIYVFYYDFLTLLALKKTSFQTMKIMVAWLLKLREYVMSQN